MVVGYCHLRAGVRSFRVDRILSLRIAPKPKSPDFERPETFDVREYITRSPWTFTPEVSERVTLEILPEAADTIHEDFGSGAVIAAADRDGHTRITFECGNPEYVTARVLAAKGAIRVVAGARVRQRIVAEMAAIEEHYCE